MCKMMGHAKKNFSKCFLVPRFCVLLLFRYTTTHLGFLSLYCNDQRAYSKKKIQLLLCSCSLNSFHNMPVTCSCVGTYLCWAWLAFPPIVFHHYKQVYHTHKKVLNKLFIAHLKSIIHCLKALNKFLALENSSLPSSPFGK